jgi:hypothetical protein
VQPAVLLLLVASAGLGYMAPRMAWLVALLLGLSIVETHFVALALGRTPPSTTILPTLLALIPSSVGAAIGAAASLMRRRVSRS